MRQSVTLIDQLLTGKDQHRFAKNIAIAFLATVVLAVSAKIQVPFYPVPMTMQSLVVLVIGAAFGWRLGGATLALYLAQGALGLPVFAQGGGWPYLLGPTGGYLLGFVAAALITGYLAERGWTRSALGAVAAMSLGHVAIFLFGFAWLAWLVGPSKAYLVGVAPFFAATLFKTLLGAALLPAAWWLLERARRA